MLRLETLDYLYRVYRFNSIRLAAESIPVAASTVSAALHKLEKEWGIPLLIRTYRGIELTDTAKKIAVASEKLFSEAENVELLIQKERNNQESLTPAKEKLTLMLSRGWWQGSMDCILAYFLEQNVDVILPDWDYDNERCLEIVEKNKMAVLLNFFTEPVETVLSHYSNVRSLKINSGKPCVLVAADSDYIPPQQKEISPKEAAKLPLLPFTEGYDQAFPIFEMLEEYGTVNIVANVSNIQVLTAMIKYGQGVSVGVKGNLHDEHDDFETDIRYVPIRTDFRLSLMLCYHKALPEGYRLILKKLTENIVY